MKNKKKIILFGGNRLSENGPIGDLIGYFKKSGIDFFLVTDPVHLKKKTYNNKSFRETIKDIKYFSFKKINEKKVSKLIDINTYGISINSIWKFSDFLINKFSGRLYNYHAANLPEERGAANITWKILQKNFKKNTINIHKVIKEFDTGEIVASKKINLKKNILPKDYLKVIALNEKSFLINFIDKLVTNKKILLKKQKGEQYYWPRLNANKDGKINWSWNVEDITLFIKSFSHPFNGAFSFINNNKIKIYDASFVKKKKFHPFQNGLVFREDNSKIYVANNTGYIVLKKTNLNSKKMLKNYIGKRFI
tara:strand:- start:9969 stop:10892 length:924 start_codon:yes stop_codon:yes gene_type:complete